MAANKQIGKLSVVLGANASPLMQDLTRAGKAVKGFASTTASALAQVSKVSGLLAGGLGLAGGVLGGFGLKKGIDEILELDMKSRRLGLTAGELRTALVAAGPAAASLGSALTTLNSKIAASSMGDLSATTSLKGLAALSGSPLKLAGKSAFETWGTVLERLHAIPNAAHRAVAAFDLLGDSAADLLPELARGGGLADAKSLARRMGLAIDDKDLANVRETGRIFRELDHLKTGFVSQFAQGMSPIIIELNKALGLMKSIDLSGFKSGLVNVVETTSKLGAGLFEAFRDPQVSGPLLSMFEGAAKFLGQSVRENLLWAFGELLKSIGTIDMGWLGKIDLGGAGDRLLQLSQKANVDAWRGRSQAWFGWQGLMHNIGQTSSGKWLANFFGNVRAGAPVGASGPLNAGGVTPQMAAALNSSFASALGGTRSPLDAFREALTQIKQFGEFGKFAGAGGGDLRSLMLGNALRSFTGGVQGLDPRFAGAATMGSRDAYSAIVRHQSGQANNVPDLLKQLLRLAERQHQAAIQVGRDLEQAIKGQDALKVEDIP